MSRFLSGAATASLMVLMTAPYAGAVPRPAAQSTEAPTVSPLKLDPTALNDEGLKKYRLGYYPVPVSLSAVKPAGILKEPTYAGKALYATVQLGDSSKSKYVLALDVVENGDYKIYVDVNHDGNLADDGDGVWKTIKSPRGKLYGINSYVLHASWGKSGKEIASGEYGVGFYCFPGPKPRLFMRREGARVGTITLDGKPHKALLVENDGDALFAKPITTDDQGKPVGDIKTHPVWLLVDAKDDGKLEMADVRAPFTLGGKTYEAKVASDGSTLKLLPTTKAVAVLEPQAPPLLTAGTVAPNFSAQGQGGKTLQLSDYKGQVVILDFWATWCGPCQRSMPHLEKVWQSVKDKDVAVVGVCVWDQKSEYDKWVPVNSSKYTFTLAFDPNDQPNSIATKLYQVSGIPTTYIIGKDGKVADAIVGYDDGDARIEQALKKLGVDVPVAASTTK